MKVRSSRLLSLFSISTILSIAVILTLTYIGVRTIYHEYVVDVAKRQSLSVTRALYAQEAPLLTNGDTTGATSLDVSQWDFNRLDRRMRDYLAPFHITQIKAFDREGRIVYSTDTSIVDNIEDNNAKLRRALNGEVVSELETEDEVTDVHGEIRRRVEVVETYLPVTNGQGNIIGAFEVYLDMTPHRQRERETIRSSVLVVAAILMATSFVQFMILRRGTAQLSEYEVKLRTMTITDGLTGLANRRFVFERGQQEFERMKRSPDTPDGADPVGCIMIDLDSFKQVNDTYGHAGGDKILTELAERLKPLMRPYDILGRYGGEEFIVLTPHADLEDTRLIAERLWQVIRGRPIVFAGEEVVVTASLGFSCVQQSDSSIEECISRADDNLYEAKRLGRDRIVP